MVRYGGLGCGQSWVEFFYPVFPLFLKKISLLHFKKQVNVSKLKMFVEKRNALWTLPYLQTAAAAIQQLKGKTNAPLRKDWGGFGREKYSFGS